MTSKKFEYLLRLGDNALILGQQVSAWCGHAPALEEDIAIANTALDLIGQATMWLNHAGAIEGTGRDADALAYLRESRAFRNVLLVEQPNQDYAQTIMRQFLFDAWHRPLLSALTRSNDREISAIAGKSVKEAAYHLERSQDLIIRLGNGTEESHSRMQLALDQLWPFCAELVTPDEVDKEAASEGFGADLLQLETEISDQWHGVLLAANLAFDVDVIARQGGKIGMHSERFGFILAEMQTVVRSHPGASW